MRSRDSPSRYAEFLSTPSARRATSYTAESSIIDVGFLSTPSARRATGPVTSSLTRAVFLSTPSARRATTAGGKTAEEQEISIHALREEGDNLALRLRRRVKNFYPRPPRGGRRTGHAVQLVSEVISIHALREEGDAVSFSPPLHPADFYPRPPRGGRLSSTISESPRRSFLSTPSARRATPSRSISLNDYIFLSTPSARRATRASCCTRPPQGISIHALREEGDVRVTRYSLSPR